MLIDFAFLPMLGNMLVLLLMYNKNGSPPSVPRPMRGIMSTNNWTLLSYLLLSDNVFFQDKVSSISKHFVLKVLGFRDEYNTQDFKSRIFHVLIPDGAVQTLR